MDIETNMFNMIKVHTKPYCAGMKLQWNLFIADTLKLWTADSVQISEVFPLNFLGYIYSLDPEQCPDSRGVLYFLIVRFQVVHLVYTNINNTSVP